MISPESLNLKKCFTSSVFAVARKTSNRTALLPPLHSSSVVLVRLLGPFSAFLGKPETKKQKANKQCRLHHWHPLASRDIVPNILCLKRSWSRDTNKKQLNALPPSVRWVTQVSSPDMYQPSLAKMLTQGFFYYQTYLISADEELRASPWASLGANASSAVLRPSASAGSAATEMSPPQFQVFY